ncbi:MAG TPA: chromosomal replication initiator protein DnaA [Pusillimonas sp.]|uniref:chromosomal replication initiator protein DnaA n=1 Tax=unclassified Pusillimonas TaxID=2640016 RepID=UPI002623C5C5|nr:MULTISPECIES: chromosomal replication initiator protein DnaA [unclassified Pusillimonas]HLU20554.1 chromosomal replication initiator protein DnaA [Pusillimonas sp.]
MKEFWQTCVQRLEQDLPPQQISAWIRPLVPLAFDETQAVLRVSAPNRFKLDWVRKNFSHQIETLASEWFERPVQVAFELAASTAAPSRPPAAAAAAPAVSSGSAADRPADNVAPQQQSPADVIHDRSRLNTELRFDNFVTGKANQLARAAALQVAENPGVSYNPLFLYGGVGLGKTHLIHAIGNALLESGKGTRVRYVHADQYVSDVVKAYQRKAFDEFKRYYHSLDLLLIDDIQFFAGKNRTQEEFFYAFEAMVAQRKQIIITSDTYPKELSNIDSRLISRFDSGLTVAIEPPELEMRVAILLRKAETEGITMPEEVAFFIAKHLRSNVRELEGALRKVSAYARFHGREVLTVEVCKDALKDLLSVSNGQITVENIQKTVADFYKIKVADMYSKRRPANIALPRQIAMYLAKELTQKSLPEIGDLFGGRDHTTVLHAVRKISDARTKQSELNHALHVLEQTLKG